MATPVPLPHVSDATIRTVYILPMITGPISLISSVYLICVMLHKAGQQLPPLPLASTEQRQRQTCCLLGQLCRTLQALPPRDRLLMGLCLMDMLGSFAFSFSTAPGPSDTVWFYPYPTYGTDATCTAQAFLVQLGLGAPIYNAAMGIFYILTIRFKVSDRFLKKFYIPAAHVLIWTSMLSLAVAGLFLEIFGFDGSAGCWIDTTGNFPYAIWFALLHLSICFAIITASGESMDFRRELGAASTDSSLG